MAGWWEDEDAVRTAEAGWADGGARGAETIGVFVISGIRLYCDGLCEILGRLDGIEIAGRAARVDVARQQLHELGPRVDAVLIDVAEPNGIEGLRAVIAAVPESRIVAITVPDRERDVIACVESGAAGFVTRDASIDALVEALRGVTRGEVHLSPRMTAALLRRLSFLAKPAEAVQALTLREREILRLIDSGLSNKMIAQQLQIEVPTVKNHVHHIIEKLGVNNRAQAAARVRGQLSA
jgi:two-component system nitrate/nitrite response regulator NarL